MTESENHGLSFSLDGRLALLRAILERQTRLSSLFVGNLIGHPAGEDYSTRNEIEEDVKHVLTLMLQAICSSATSLLLLLKEESGLRTLDCYSITRSIVESAINICFIVAKGKPEANEPFDMQGRNHLGTFSGSPGLRLVQFESHSGVRFPKNYRMNLKQLLRSLLRLPAVRRVGVTYLWMIEFSK